VPTLREVLARFPDIPVIIEMKVNSAAMGEAMAAVVRAAGAVDRVCAAGFGARALRAARRALPGMASSACQPEARLAVYASMLRCPVRHVAYQAYQLPEWAGRIHVVTPRFVSDSHAAGLAVQVWTVDDRPDMERLLGWGVDALISNRPDLAVTVRDDFVVRSSRTADGV
jgi:glycerophosphoryl diester phosphodiesterase